MHEDSTGCVINVAYGDTAACGLPVSQGVPLPRGMMCPGDRLAVVAPGGEWRPAAGRPLAQWPDGSVRWLLVSFGAREAGTHRLVVNPDTVPTQPEVRLTQVDGRWIIDVEHIHHRVDASLPGIGDGLFDGGEGCKTGDHNGVSAGVSLAVYNGVPYVTFSGLNLANQKYYVSVKYLSGGSWEDLGQPWFSYPFPRSQPNLVMHNGTPYVAYHSWDLPLWGPVVQRFNGGWETVGDPDFAPEQPSAELKIAIESDSGTPYVAYAIPGVQYPVPTNDAVVMKFTDMGWQYVGAMRFVKRVSPTFSLAVSNGTPYFAFLDNDHDQRISVMKFKGTTWEYVGSPGFPAGIPTIGPSFLAVHGDTPYVAFSDYTAENKVTVMRYAGQTPPIQTATFRSIGGHDGWVLESGENTNKGGQIEKRSKFLRLGDDAKNKQYRSILSFDTAALPDDAVVTKVTLKVKRQRVLGGGNPVSKFKGFIMDIRNGTFGATGLQKPDFQTRADRSTAAMKKNTGNNKWYTLDLSRVKDFVNLQGLTQGRLRFKWDDDNNKVANYLILYSGNATKADRPQLIVQYYVL